MFSLNCQSKLINLTVCLVLTPQYTISFHFQLWTAALFYLCSALWDNSDYQISNFGMPIKLIFMIISLKPFGSCFKSKHVYVKICLWIRQQCKNKVKVLQMFCCFLSQIQYSIIELLCSNVSTNIMYCGNKQVILHNIKEHHVCLSTDFHPPHTWCSCWQYTGGRMVLYINPLHACAVMQYSRYQEMSYTVV